MMTKVELYQSKMIILDEALDKIKSHDSIAAGHYGNEPRGFLRKVHTIADRVEDVTIWINNPSEAYSFLLLWGIAEKDSSDSADQLCSP